MINRIVAGCAVLILFSTLLGCTASGRPPLEALYYQTVPKNPNLIIFLRGMGGNFNCLFSPHKCFDKEGFVAAVRERNLPYDMVAPDAHLGYYQARTLHLRLKADVIDPAREAGYEKIWLVGTSMGGLGALLFLSAYPDDIAGVLALGPYLGDTDFVLGEISQSGGLTKWDPGPYDPEADWQRTLWYFLKEHEHTGQDRVPVFIGLGKDDPYYRSQKVLADYLPAERVIETNGGHLLSTFKRIWLIFLDNHMLAME